MWLILKVTFFPIYFFVLVIKALIRPRETMDGVVKYLTKFAVAILVLLQNTVKGVVKHLTPFVFPILGQDDKLAHEYDRLMRKLQSLERENDSLTAEIKRYKSRVSKMASEKLTEGNPTVEDLNDPHRPTALARRWNGLFRCGEYWTAFENVRKVKEQDGAAPFLYTVCQVTYETTEKYLRDLTQALSNEVSDRQLSGQGPVEQRGGKSLNEFLSDNGEAESMLTSLKDVLSRGTKDGSAGEGGQVRKAISHLLKSRSPPAALNQAVTRAVGELEISPEDISSFVHQLTELIYYMRAQDIKVVVDFDCKTGMRMNPELYEVESGKTVDNPRSAVVKAVMRPALLRHEQGPVLCKGEVELETSAKLQLDNNSNTPTQDVGTQTTVDLTASDEKNARQSPEGDTASTDEENKAASQSTHAALVTAEQSQQSRLAVAGKADFPLQNGLGESNPSAANPLGGVHDDPAEVGPAAPAVTDQASALAQENTVTETSLQPPQNARNQQEVQRSQAATTIAAASPAPPADQSADTEITLENEVGF